MKSLKSFLKIISNASMSLLAFSFHLQAQHWERFPINGGEGGQRPTSMAADRIDGNWVLMGTDVGGFYSSIDGGAHWKQCNVGFDSYGSMSLIIDPKNNQRAFVVGCSSKSQKHLANNGIWRTTDKGLTWKWVYEDALSGDKRAPRDRREQITIDPTSYDAKLGYCKIIYWSPRKQGNHGQAQLVRSTDGGDTWAPLQGVKGLCNIVVAPDSGDLFVGNWEGLFRSQDKGNTFSKIIPDVAVSAIDAVGDKVFIGTAEVEKRGTIPQLFVWDNRTETLVEVERKGLPSKNGKRYFSLKVSPADPNRMLIMANKNKGHDRYVSHDGGQSWKPTQDYVSKRPLIAGQKNNEKYADHAWHPTDPNICWSTNHDYAVKSFDGGKGFEWSNAGFSGSAIGQIHLFSLNVHHPEYIMLPIIDWNGGVTLDGGNTWKALGLKRFWGHTFGGYVVEPGVWFFGNNPSTVRGYWNPGKKISLFITRDNGKTLTEKKLDISAVDPVGCWNAYQDPVKKDVWFYANWRSEDAGHHWSKMKNCVMVITHDRSDNVLYGWGRGLKSKSNDVVRSTDHGRTWELVYTAQRTVRDLAVDQKNKILYVCTDRSLERFDLKNNETLPALNNFPEDQKGNLPKLWSIGLDPVDTDVLYLANGGNYYQPDTSVLRSTDRGNSWQSLFASERWNNLHLRQPGGGSCSEAVAIRVRADTREAIVATNTFGWWKIGPPEKKHEWASGK